MNECYVRLIDGYIVELICSKTYRLYLNHKLICESLFLDDIKLSLFKYFLENLQFSKVNIESILTISKNVDDFINKFKEKLNVRCTW